MRVSPSRREFPPLGNTRQFPLGIIVVTLGWDKPNAIGGSENPTNWTSQSIFVNYCISPLATSWRAMLIVTKHLTRISGGGGV